MELKPWLTHIFTSKLPANAREKIEDIILKADIGENIFDMRDVDELRHRQRNVAHASFIYGSQVRRFVLRLILRVAVYCT